MTRRLDNPPITPILEYYGGTVPTRRGWVKMHCPFHDDTHSSATVSVDEGAFCCFACQVKGNGYTIIMKREGVDFVKALDIAQGIFDQSGQVLPQLSSRGGRLSKVAGNKSRGGSYSTLGRRLRSTNGS